jgi:hypothetical protein
LRLFVDSWVKQGHENPFHYPKTRDEATLLRSNMIIPQPIPQPLHPAFVQSLGQDPTTFDDQEITDTAAHDSDSDSDSFSSAVNLQVAQQNQHIPAVGPVQLHSLAAISTQIQQRLNYDLHRLLPSLHGLSNLLSDASTQSMPLTPELEEFSDLLSSMRMSIDQMTQNATGTNSEAPIPSWTSDLIQAAAQHPSSSKCTRHPFLLPPSPERRQKRKDSYAPL